MKRSVSPFVDSSADTNLKVFPLGYEQGFIRPGYVAERIASYVLQSTASAAISTWDIPG